MKAKEILRILKITRPTLCNYVKNGTIKATMMPNGQYNYDSKSVYDFLNNKRSRLSVIYSRVSTSKQKADLINQEDTLKKFMNHNGITVDKSYSDIKSGMSFERKGFSQLMEDVISYRVDTIYITYKDRLTRSAFNVIETLFSAFGTRIIALDSIDNPKTTEQEFLEEISTILHTFSMKMYSSRRKEKLKLIAKDIELESSL